MKPMLYIETSVVGYLTARPSPNTIIAGHQAATQELWAILRERFSPYISDIVLQEAAQGDSGRSEARLAAIHDLPVLDVDTEVERIAGLLLDGNAVPGTCPEDAVHIAVAAVNGMDLIATWNFKHINNPVMKQRMRELLMKTGFLLPEICSPDELLEMDNG